MNGAARRKLKRERQRIEASASSGVSKDIRATLTAQAEIRAAESDGGPVKVRIVAYTGGALQLGGFDLPVVIDVDSMIDNPSMPLITDHRTFNIDAQIGGGSAVGKSPEIIVDGVIAPGTIRGDHIIALGKAGVRVQASVGGPARSYDEYGPDESVTVNGKQFNGPLYVARGFRIEETSLVVLGADRDTDVSIAARIAAAGKDSGMNWEQWLKAMGFEDPKKLTEEQTKSLRAMYDAGKSPEQAKKSGKDDGGDDAGTAGKIAAGKVVEPKKGVHDAGDEHNDDADPVKKMRAEMSAEVKRVAAIREVCEGKHPTVEAEAIEKGWTRDATELAVIKAERQSVNISTGGSRNGAPAEAKVIEAALCRSSGMDPEKLVKDYGEKVIEASDDYRGFGIHALLHHQIRAGGGYATPGVMNDTIIREAFAIDRELRARSVRAAGGVGFTTTSLSGILGNVANKALMKAFTAVNGVAGKICNEHDTNDFKTYTKHRLNAGAEVLKVGPDGELKHMTLSEESFSNKAETYGRLVVLTRQMIINDDLMALTDLTALMGRQQAIAREKAVFTLLLSNPGSPAFFSTTNKNYISGSTTVLSIDGLTQAEQKFMDQVDDQGMPIMANPAILLVPTALSATAAQLMASTELREGAASKAPSKNPHAGKFETVVSTWLNAQSLTGSSATGWYLFADPRDLPAMEIAYVKGVRAPVIESGEVDFDMLGIGYRTFWDWGVALMDHRGAVHSKGAA